MLSILTLVVFLLTVACGSSAAEPVYPTPLETPATASVPGQNTGPVGQPEEYDLVATSGLVNLDSYRVHYTFKWETSAGGQVEVGYWDIWGEFVRQPRARRLVWTATHTGGAKQELIQLGEDIYMDSGSDWLAMTTAHTDIFEDNPLLSSPFDVISGYRWQLVQEDVVVNGASTDHYAFDGSTLGAALGLDSDAEVEGDVWIARELEVVVKYQVNYQGQNPGGGSDDDGTVRLTFDLTNINETIVIVAPRGVKPALPEDIPIAEGAAALNAFSGIIIYRTTKSVEEMTSFYQAEMPPHGWTEVLGPAAGVNSFAKEGRAAQIMISAEDSGTSVAITFDA